MKKGGGRMSLLVRLGVREEIQLSQQGALLLSVMTMICINGDMDYDEVAIIERMNSGNSANDWENVYKIWSNKSTQECIDIVAQIAGETEKKTIITNLINLAMPDALLHEPEKTLLVAYVKALDIDITYVEQVMDVIRIKNQVFFIREK